ncbi:MAG: uridine kinase [Gammaproteobacteria bacterium]|nr:uridine kinase [Gammaproteobacteria bacterium]MCH9763047.1 uridine kinase [Gammaproteobacteria bacterium]
MPKNTCPILIGVAGSSGAGKTSVANEIAQQLNQENPGSCIIISSDRYYRNRPDLSFEEKNKLNYDHPDSIEFSLCRLQLLALKAGHTIEAPNYALETHSRIDETTQINPAAVQVIILEGILILANAANLSDLCDAKIFVESTPEICLERRIERDVRERGRNKATVIAQYEETVRPMDTEFVRPSRNHADLVVKNTAASMEATGLRFNLNAVMRYLEPLLADGALPTNQIMCSWFTQPTEITLTGHAHLVAEAEQSEDVDCVTGGCVIS